MNIDPRGLGVIEWTAQSTPALSKLAFVPRLLDAAKWKQWALDVIQEPGVAKFCPPTPFTFQNWWEWATRFNQLVPL